MFTFDSKIQLGPQAPQYSEDEIKAEPMLFNCDSNFAYHSGGPITRDFLELLYENDKIDPSQVVIDSRVHMSYRPGIFLAIEGYHHDDVPRTRLDGQPNYISPGYKSKHCMMLANGDVAPTEFAIGKAIFNDVPLGQTIYKEWHNVVESYINEGKLLSWLVPTNYLCFFDWNTWHKATSTKKTGWRFFIRASWNTDRIQTVTNEIRKQVQVYVPLPYEGW